MLVQQIHIQGWVFRANTFFGCQQWILHTDTQGNLKGCGCQVFLYVVFNSCFQAFLLLVTPSPEINISSPASFRSFLSSQSAFNSHVSWGKSSSSPLEGVIYCIKCAGLAQTSGLYFWLCCWMATISKGSLLFTCASIYATWVIIRQSNARLVGIIVVCITFT